MCNGTTVYCLRTKQNSHITSGTPQRLLAGELALALTAGVVVDYLDQVAGTNTECTCYF